MQVRVTVRIPNGGKVLSYHYKVPCLSLSEAAQIIETCKGRESAASDEISFEIWDNGRVIAATGGNWSSPEASQDAINAKT